MPTDYESALQFLYGRIDYERTPTIPYQEAHLKLQRMERLLELIGDPQQSLTVIHVAGTKGKGSTSTMVAAILRAAGFKTGLYSSPHLNSLEERIRIDNQPCSPKQLVELVAAIQPAVIEMDYLADTGKSSNGRPTYFEIMTAMSMLHFWQQRVDYSVLEVGLGGRLDSTNVCSPEITVITTISLDHTLQLGNTLASIATEKAGIIKPGVPLISGVRDGEARSAIEQVVKRQQHVSSCLTLGEDFEFQYSADGDHGCRFDYLPSNSQLGSALQNVRLGMLGAHQAANAAIAITVARLLTNRRLANDKHGEAAKPINDAALYKGLATARCPARIEQMSSDPPVILDAAHNGASMAALVAALDDGFGRRPRVVVFGTTRGKDITAMLKCIVGACDCLILTQYHHNPRSYPAEKLAAHVDAIETADAIETNVRPPTIFVQPNPIKAWRLACELAGSDKLICVTGSFFLAAELRPVIIENCGPFAFDVEPDRDGGA